MSELKVSVVMITYEHSEFISQAIDSILEQKTNFEYELIIANDNSPDNTDIVVKNIIKEHSEGARIKYFHQKQNLGVASNFCFALRKATGEYVALCEGDDFWRDSTKLQKQVDFLERNPDYIVSYHNTITVDEDGFPVETIKSKRRKQDLSSSELLEGATPGTLSMCFRNVVRDYPREGVVAPNGDTFLASYLGNFGHGKYLDDIAPGAYRIHGGGVWSMVDRDKKLKAKTRTFRALQKLHDRIGNRHASLFFRDKLRNIHKMQLVRSLDKSNPIDMLRHLSAYSLTYLR